MKVGRDLQDDLRRLTIAREAVGPSVKLMIDANQVWGVDEAIDGVGKLGFSEPWFIEEPTSPDDIESHRHIRAGVAPVQVAIGEMCQIRIMFRHFIMRDAIDVVQIDACRIGGVNEVLAVLLMAAKYGKLVCPHAGGVGLYEYVQHLSMIDYVVVSGSREGGGERVRRPFARACPRSVRHPRRRPHAPEGAGFSIEMKPETRDAYRFRG